MSRNSKQSTGNSVEETELLGALLAGGTVGHARWGEFVKRYERLIASCVLKALRRYGASFSSEDLDDLIAEVWVALLRDDLKKLRQYQADRGFRIASWVGLIATNLTIDHLRARAAAARPLDEVREGAWAQVTEDAPDAELMARERAALARRAFARLTLEERTFLSDCFHDEQAPEDMARARRVSVNTIYSRKFKLRAKLQSALQEMELLAA